MAVMTVLAVPFALIHTGATMSAICLLYAIVVVPIVAVLSREQIRKIDRLLVRQTVSIAPTERRAANTNSSEPPV